MSPEEDRARAMVVMYKKMLVKTIAEAAVNDTAKGINRVSFRVPYASQWDLSGAVATSSYSIAY